MSTDSTGLPDDPATAQVSESEPNIRFPEIVDDKIRTAEFLEAAHEVVQTIDKFGKLFAPVKHDMQGNIDKLTTRYSMDKEGNATLQDMILIEKTSETNLIAADALLWLTRGLHMILLFFEKIIENSKTETPTDDLVAFLRKSYKEALEPYHGWMAQQLFGLLSRMVPARSQFLQSLANDRADRVEFVLRDLERSLVNLRKNVLAIQTFYKIHDLENVSVA